MQFFIDLKRVKLETGTIDATIDEIGKECTPKPDLVNNALNEELNDMLENMENNVLRKYDLGCRRTTETVSRKVATPIADINVKADCDTDDCFITDCCILDQQYMVACDQNNCSVKLLDLESLSVVYVRSVRTTPEAATKINDREIALVRGQLSRSIIEFLSLTLSRTLIFRQKRAIHTEMYCTDIVFYQNSLIVSMHEYENKGKIQILSMRGKILFSLEQDETGGQLFNFPDYLAIDLIRKRVYVSDCGGRITQTQNDNMEISQVMHAWNPQGITVDEDGLVYICEMGTECVQAFDFDNERTYVLIKNDSPSWNPRSVCYNKLDSKLYVGQRNSNYMKVYKVESKEFVKCKVLEKVEKWLPL